MIPLRGCLTAGILLAGLALGSSACTSGEATPERHLARADALVKKGQHADAILEYRSALQIDPRLGEARLKLADAYLQTGNRPAAGEEIIRAADLLPSRLDVQLRAGSVLLTVKEFISARKYADAALALDPKNVDALVIRAMSLAGLRDVGAAMQDLEAAIVAAPADARPHIALGSIRADADTAEAEHAFRRALAADPASIQARAALGLFFWQKDRLAEAQQSFEAAVALQPVDAIANRTLALFLLSQQQDGQAEAPLRRLVEAGDQTATIVLGDIYTRSGRTDMGRALYERLGPASPRHAGATARLAALDYAAGRKDAARERIAAALQRLPNDPTLLVAQARWLLAERQGARAITVAKTAVDGDERSADARFVLGMAHAANGEDEEAIQQFREALRIDPRMSVADIELSRLTLRPGTTDQAMDHAAAALTTAPRDYSARLAFARALAASGKSERAREELQELAKAFPNAAPVHALYGEVLRAAGNNTEAMKRFDLALTLDPSDPQALAARIGYDLQAGRAADARGRITAALQHKDHRAAVLIMAAELEHAAGDNAAAERYVRQAIDAEPSNARAYGQLAHLYVGMNRLEEGKAELKAFVARRPGSVAAWTMIGLIEELQGRTDDAIATYERILVGGGRAPIAANNLAYIFLERGVHVERALQLAQDARQQLPADPNIRDTLGWALFKNGLTADAIHELERTVEADPRNAGYLYHLGLAYEKAGQIDKAHAVLERALGIEPGMANAEAVRARLAALKKRMS